MNIKVSGCEPENVIVKNLLEALFKKQNIELEWNADIKNTDNVKTFVLLFLCHYEVEEKSILIQAIRHASHILQKKENSQKLKVLIILYRYLHVNFPERKLQREKEMSKMASTKLLDEEAPLYANRIQITHEFGTNDVQDSSDFLKGESLFVEVINLL